MSLNMPDDASINYLDYTRVLNFLLFFPCKAEQPLQGMELQEKGAQKHKSIQKFSLQRTYS